MNQLLFSVTDATYTYDTAVKYTCNVGYNLVGSPTVVCKERGIWDQQAPVCEIVSCGPPPDVENSVQDREYISVKLFLQKCVI